MVRCGAAGRGFAGMAYNKPPITAEESTMTTIELKKETAVSVLRRLAAENGGVLEPSQVVDAARAEGSPLHTSFTWDDGEAAEKWRVHQARNLIRVMVEYIDVGKSEPTKVFVALRSESKDGGGYRRTVDVMSDAEMRAQLLAQALEDAKLFKLKYKRLTELAEVFDAMTRAEKKALA